MKQLWEYLYKKVKIETKDHRELEGDVISIVSGVETNSGEEEISIDYGSYIEVVRKSAIKSIEVLDE